MVNAEDLIIYTVNGLPASYNVFKTSLRIRSQVLTFDELHILMKTKETTNEKQSKLEDSSLIPNLGRDANFESSSRGN